MGIDINALKFLATAGAAGCDFTRTVMVGRQRLYVAPADVDRVVPPRGPDDRSGGADYAEWLLRRLGAQSVDAVDVSDYEGASLTHDLNQPLPAAWHGRYTAVVECGTLEHVFNFPAAIANCMNLLGVGGTLILYTVANNFCGHGFYQFSPELFYRVFQPENGFAVERVVACDAFYESAWHAVADPRAVGGRVEIAGPYPVMLMVQARKVAAVPPFRSAPQQSDYAPAWSGAATHADHLAPARRRPSLRSLVPGWLTRRVQAYRSARQYRGAGLGKAAPG